jgi:Leucine-rich repeat (LRR) protein
VGLLYSLQTLLLDHNKIAWISPALGRLSCLTRLSLSHNCVTELPVEFFNLTDLVELLLDHNHFATISGAISSCLKLKDLRLSHNVLKIFPESVGSIKGLERLSIGHNAFRRVPDVLTSIRALNELWISEMNSYDVAGELPEYFSKLTTLKVLHINDDERRDLPTIVTRRGVDSIIDWVERVNDSKTSKELELSRLLLKECPFAPYKPLLILNLAGNRIEYMNENVLELATITECNLSSNRILEIPNDIYRLFKCTSLNLTQNRLVMLPESVGLMTSLTKLNANVNRIQVCISFPIVHGSV